jgi:hypothetical protein
MPPIAAVFISRVRYLFCFSPFFPVLITAFITVLYPVLAVGTHRASFGDFHTGLMRGWKNIFPRSSVIFM